MGTTLILLWLINDTAHVAWCGDSRCYRLRDGRLRQISKDHSYVQELVDKKLITSDEAFYHPKKNIVTQSLGDSMNKLEPSYTSVPLSINDRFLLCSDGLNTMLMDDHIQQIATSSTDIQECTQRLVEAANTAGGYDNITVVLTDVVTGPAVSKQEPLARQKVSTPKTNNHTTSGGKKSIIQQYMLPIGVGLGLLVGGLLWLLLGRSSDNSAATAAAKAAAAFTKDSLREVKLARDKKEREEAAAAEKVPPPASIPAGKVTTVIPNAAITPKKPEKTNMTDLGKEVGQHIEEKQNPKSGNPSFEDVPGVKIDDPTATKVEKSKKIFTELDKETKGATPPVSPIATPIPKTPIPPKKNENEQKKK
jgi:Protein phosphatase 2C